MAYRIRRGMGDVLNASAGTSLDCGLFAGGVFKPECWCYDWPTLCKSISQDAYNATMTLANPDTRIPVLPVLAKGATAPSDAATPTDPSQAVADQTILNQQTVLDVVRSQSPDGTGGGVGLSPLAWLAIATVVVLGVAAVGSGGPRRYGR